LIRGEQLRKVIPEAMRRAVASIGQQLIFDGRAGLGTLQGLAGTLGTSIANAGRIFREDERAALAPSIARLTPTDLCAPERRRSEMFSDRCSSVQRATAVDFSSYMVDDVLVKVDRASMLSSLEVRAPFLDKGIIDFAFTSVADHLRATSRERKVLLKKLGAKVLPAQLDLSRKQGFSIPLADWLRQTWRGTVSEVVADRDQSIISNGEIRRLQKLLDQGKPVQDRLFSLVVLRMWERTYQVTDVSDG
jgi:asparagine synthase (glutamine-hydrolysing)